MATHNRKAAKRSRLKTEYAIVLSALQGANILHERPVTVAEIIGTLADADAARLERQYASSLTLTVSKILRRLIDRELAFSPGQAGRNRYYVATGVLDAEAAEMPVREGARWRRNLALVRAAVEELGRAVLLGDVVNFAREHQVGGAPTEEEISIDVRNLVTGGDLAVVDTIRADERGGNLYLPVEFDPAEYETDEPLTWLEAVARAFRDIWAEREDEAKNRGSKPRPVPTGEVRARVRKNGWFSERLEDPQLLVNALPQLARGAGAVVQPIRRNGQRALLWAPAGYKKSRLDIGRAHAGDAERVTEATARAEARLRRPATLHDVRDEIDMDDSLALEGDSPLRAVLADAAKKKLDHGDGVRKSRVRQRLHKVGTVRGKAHYSVQEVSAGRAYVSLRRLEGRWERLAAEERLGRLPECTLWSVAVGRARIIRQEAGAIGDRAQKVIDRGSAQPWVVDVLGEIRERAADVQARASEWLEGRTTEQLPVKVDTRTLGWTAEELLTVLEPLYPQAQVLDEPRKLIPLLDRAIWRIPNPDFTSRRSGNHRTASEYLFECTDTLIRAALYRGGPECRLMATFATNELDRLRDVRFVLPMLEVGEPDVRLKTVACLAFIGGEAALESLRRTACEDPDPGVRESALWAYGFAGAADGVDLAKERQTNDPDVRVREFAGRIGVEDSGRCWSV